jgi:hypothetical protein
MCFNRKVQLTAGMLALQDALQDLLKRSKEQSKELLKCKQEEKRKQEEARALRSGLEASSHACTGFAALESLGTAYKFLRDKRSEPGGCSGDVQKFLRLENILREHQAHRSFAEVLEVAANSAQYRAAGLRGELRLAQQEIEENVAACHKKRLHQIDDIQDLPDEVKQEIQKRNLIRSKVAKELRDELIKLQETLKTATGIALPRRSF